VITKCMRLRCDQEEEEETGGRRGAGAVRVPHRQHGERMGERGCTHGPTPARRCGTRGAEGRGAGCTTRAGRQVPLPLWQVSTALSGRVVILKRLLGATGTQNRINVCTCLPSYLTKRWWVSRDEGFVRCCAFLCTPGGCCMWSARKSTQHGQRWRGSCGAAGWAPAPRVSRRE
jgi:hypothetical protein